MVEVRTITEGEIASFRQAIGYGFGNDDPVPDDAVERLTALLPLETTIAAFDRGHVVATFASYDLDTIVPGGAVDMAGTTMVTVHPTHRRRGLLTDMMGRHLRQAIDRGQPIAGLWASEEQIYGRFGYGLACFRYDLTIPARATVPHGPDDVGIRPATTDEARAALPPIYDRFVDRTPGTYRRWPAWWEQRHFEDPTHRRPSGATGRRHVVAERGGTDVGYAVYRHADRDLDDATGGSILVTELIADDDDVRRALWSYLTNIDLYPNVTWWNAPVDEPVLIEADLHRAVTAKLGDTLWARILDVPVALEARRYERDGQLRIGVTDRFLDRDDTYSLTVEDGRATCKPTTGEPDVALDVADLGALYFGGRSARILARARRIEGPPAAVDTLDQLVRTAAAPYCAEVF